MKLITRVGRSLALVSVAGCLVVVARVVPAAADAPPPGPDRRSDQQALDPLQVFVGHWRGVGQPQRGSNRGAWVEEASWGWRFDDDRAAIAFDAPDGQVLRGGRIAPGDEPGTFVLTATLASAPAAGDAAQHAQPAYVGRFDDEGHLVFRADAPPEGAPARVTLRTVADGDRLLVLYERQRGEDRFSRIAEVGYTRQGSDFARGTGGPECVVTGGHGSIEVEYQGRTYYVCCTGCRDLFNDDPEGVLAEYRQRKARERDGAEAD